MKVESIAKTYAIQISNGPGNLVVRVGTDGSVEYGPGFTADSAAKEFWEMLAKAFPGIQK